MNGWVEWKNDGAIQRVIDSALADTAADSDLNRAFRADMIRLAYEDHAYMLDAGVDRKGRKFAPLAKSTLKKRPRPGDKPLNPIGSRILSNYEVTWDQVADTRSILTARVRGVGYMGYHIAGTPRMPARDISGFTPRCFSRIDALGKAHLAAVARKASLAGRAAGFFRQLFRR